MPDDHTALLKAVSTTPPSDPRDAYLSARARLDAATQEQSAASITISAEDAAALLRGYPPDPDLPKTFAKFSARFVPFLRHVQERDVFKYSGITVTPHPEGGAVLAASDGYILLLARDREAEVSPGGCRVIMPPDALDACEPPTPTVLVNQGDVYEVPCAEPWTLPHEVLCIGASLMVSPAGQPPGTEPEDGGILWGGMIETGNHWRDTDARRVDPVAWWNAASTLADRQEPVPLVLGLPVLACAVNAMAAVPDVNFWHFTDLGCAVGMRPAIYAPNASGVPDPDEVAIIAMKGKGFVAGAGVPGWLDVCVAACKAAQ